MSIMTVKFLYRRGPRILNLATHNILRRNMNQKDPCSQSTQTSPSTNPDPPPCPPMPQCPPAMCHPVMDTNNPCNYCPPPCIDPDAADVTKLKKIQCKFQSNPDVPIHLKNGNFDVFLYQLTLITIIVSFVYSGYLFF